MASSDDRCARTSAPAACRTNCPGAMHEMRLMSARARPEGVPGMRREAPRRRSGPARQGQAERPALRRPRSGAVPARRARRGQAGGGGNGATQGSAHRAASASPPMAARSASRAVARGAHTTAVRYHARRAAGSCVRCARPTFEGQSRCGRCLALERERVSPERKSAVRKRRYSGRRARGECVDCKAPVRGAARCPRCAYRSNSRAPERHLVAMWPPQITVIELRTSQELGTFETEAEAAACLVFEGLRIDQVEIRANVPLMALCPP